MSRTKLLMIAIAFSVILDGCHLGIFSPAKSMMEEAEELARNSQFQEAITLYQRHMQKRLAVLDRPDWENPYLYLLTIGDLELRQDKIDSAISTYEEAEKKGVSKELVSDRYRGVAEHFEQKHLLEAAVEILKRFRDRDPLLYDGMLDRISKQIVAEEDGIKR